jgi:outer membrane protein
MEKEYRLLIMQKAEGVKAEGRKQESRKRHFPFFLSAFCISAFSLLFLTKGYSQKLWTLEKCISHAIENNIQIKTQELGLEINNNQLLRSKLGLLPNISAGASENFSFGRKVDPFTNDFAPENYNSTNFQ